MGKRSGLWVGVHIWQDMCSLHTDYCHLFHVLSLFDFICLLSVGLRFNAVPFHYYQCEKQPYELRWAELVVRIGEKRSAVVIVVVKTEALV